MQIPCFVMISRIRNFRFSYTMRIAIIGGGLSGTLVAYNLLKTDLKPITIYLFEKDEHQLSRGIAYRASNETHLLNVPAVGMNIYGLQEGDFYRWLQEKGHTSYTQTDFVPRYLFGNYLAVLFKEALGQAKKVTVTTIHDEVVDVVKGKDLLTVVTASGQSHDVSKAVLANGILPPADPFQLTEQVRQTGLYQSNPWHFITSDKFLSKQKITLIGTGLTMLDYAVGLLNDERSFSITAFSRRGFLPLPHKSYDVYDFPDYNVIPTEDIGTLLNTIREYYQAHRSKGLDWRALIDRIRSQAPELWQALSDVSKKRFIRHLKPYWEIHRHRAPQKALNTIQKAAEENRFKLLRGRIQKVEPVAGKLHVTLVNSRGTTEISTDYLLNSSGLQQDVSLTSDRLLTKLLQRGYMIPDKTGLGVETDNDGALQSVDGERNIFTLGALRRASVFECTAAKEVGHQAFQLSKRLSIENVKA